MEKSKFRVLLLQIFILFVIFGAFLFFKFAPDFLFPSCFWLENFDIICPSCGATRAFQSIFQGKFISAFAYNPFIFVLFFYLLILDVVYCFNTFFGKSYFKFLYPKPWKIILFFILWFFYVVFINIYYWFYILFFVYFIKAFLIWLIEYILFFISIFISIISNLIATFFILFL